MKDSLLERFKKYIDSPECKIDIAKKIEKDELKFKRQKRIHALDQKHFNRLMKYLIKKHGEEWVEKCNAKGYEPYPSELLYLVLSCSEKYGKDLDWSKDYDFPIQVKRYMGYDFFWLWGQGCINRVYKGKNIVIDL